MPKKTPFEHLGQVMEALDAASTVDEVQEVRSRFYGSGVWAEVVVNAFSVATNLRLSELPDGTS